MSTIPVRQAALWIAAALFCVSWLRAEPIAAGPSRLEFPNGGEPITLFTYKPPIYKDGPLLVFVAKEAEDALFGK